MLGGLVAALLAEPPPPPPLQPVCWGFGFIDSEKHILPGHPPSRARRHARQRGEQDNLRCKLPPDPAAAATASLHLFGGIPAYVHEVSDRDAALHRLPDLLLDVPLK